MISALLVVLFAFFLLAGVVTLWTSFRMKTIDQPAELPLAKIEDGNALRQPHVRAWVKRSRQLELPGTKKAVGRPRVHPVGEARHVKRPRITVRDALHVTLRTAEGVRYLRNRHTCEAVRRGLEVTYRRDDVRICHLSVQHGHIHLIVEADNTEALARGMQSFQIACAKRLNRIFTRRNGFKCDGPVFADRYHARVLRSPTQTRRALRYVLSNFRKHGHGRGHVTDPYSTADAFDGWRRPVSRDIDGPLAGAPTAPARSWLLTDGWRRGGLLDPAEPVGKQRPA